MTDDCGTVYTASYDNAGRLVKEKSRADSEKVYEYDNDGYITKVMCGGEVVEAYDYGTDSLVVTVTDGNGNDYFYNYDAYENRFVYDAIGNIIEAENSYGKTVYKYDQGGRLIYQKDVTTGEGIHFYYDDAGNKTRLLSSNRETVYTYGKNNEVKEIFDNKQRISVKLKYDMNGRETERQFGNGTSETTLYDRAGRVTVKAQNSDRGELVWTEGYLYGEDGKRTATVDNDGRVTLYEYKKKDQLQTIWYPYTQDMINLLKAEAEENGLPTLAELGENRFLPSDIKYVNNDPVNHIDILGLCQENDKETSKLVVSNTFSKYGLIIQDEFGLLVGSTSLFNQTTVINDDTISTFVTGMFGGYPLVDKYTFYGTASLIVDGNNIEQKDLQYPSQPVIYEGDPFVIVGETTFDTKIDKDSLVAI